MQADYQTQPSDIDSVINNYNGAAAQQSKPLINLPASSGPAEQGNIDLSNRPVVRNADGSISTVRSMSINMDGREVLIPTVSDDGRILTENEAVDQYIKTGQHLGKFDTPEAATDYAKKLHDQQDEMYSQRPASLDDFDFQSTPVPPKRATNDFIAGFGQAQSGYGTGMRYMSNALNAPDLVSDIVKTTASPVIAGIAALTEKEKQVKPIPAPQPGSFTHWLENKGQEWEQSGRETYEKYKSDDLTEEDRERLGPIQSALVETWTDVQRNIPFTITNLPLNAIPVVGTPLAAMAEASVEAGNRYDEDYKLYYDEGMRQGMSLKDADEYARGQAVNRADKVMVGNTALLAVTNKLEWGLFTRGAGPIAKRFGGRLAKQWDKLSPGAKVAATLIANGLSESVMEELPQSNIQRYVTGEGMDWNPFSDENFREMRSAFAIGAVSAGVGAAGRGVMDSRRRSGVTKELQTLSGGAVDPVTQKQVENAERELQNQITANFDLARQGEKAIKQGKTEQETQKGQFMIDLATKNLSQMDAQYGIFNEAGKINITNSTIAKAGVDYGVFKITPQEQQQEQVQDEQQQGPSLNDEDFFRLATEFNANQASQATEDQTPAPVSIPQPQVVEFSDARQAEQFGQANPAWRRYNVGGVQYFQAPSPGVTPSIPGGDPGTSIEIPSGSGITLTQAREQIPQSVDGMTNAQRFAVEKSMDNAARAGDYRAAAGMARQLGSEQLARKYEEADSEEQITRALNSRNYQEAARLAQAKGDAARAQRFISLGELIANTPQQQTFAKQGQPGEANTNAALFREQRRMAQAYQNLSGDEQYFLDILRSYNVSLDAVRDEITGEINSRIQQEVRLLKQEAAEGGVELISKQDGEGKVRASTNPDWYRQLYPMNNQKYHDLAVSILRGSRRHWSVDETISDEFSALEATVNAIETTRENINQQVPEWVQPSVAGGTGGNRDLRGAAEQFQSFGRSSIESEESRAAQSRKQKQVEEALRSEALRKKMDTPEGRAQVEKLPDHIRTALKERQQQEQGESQVQKAKPFLAQTEVDRQQERQELAAELVSQGMSEDHAQQTANSFIERRKAPRVVDETIGYQVKGQFTPTVERAWDEFKANGRQFAFANVDFLNLGGLNGVAGNEAADKHLRVITKIVSDEVGAVADHAQYFRWGGDEWRILTPDISKETLDTALQRAQAQIADYAKSNGLDKLMHGKKTHLQTGIGIHYAADEFNGYPSYQNMISDSELAVLNKKNQLFAELEKQLKEQGGNSNVIRVETESVGSGASGEQSGRTGQGNQETESGNRQKENNISESKSGSRPVNEAEPSIKQQGAQQTVQQSEQQSVQQTEQLPESGNNITGFDGSQANRDRLRNQLLELTGKKPKQKKLNIVDDSDAALAQAMKELQSELSKISSNPVFNPTLMGAAFKVGAIHMQRGINNFSDWSATMVDTVGERIRPYLKSVWNSITAWPEDVKYNDRVANSLFEYAGILYQDGVTNQTGMEQRIQEDLGADFVPMVKAAFSGVSEWPGFEGGSQYGERGRENLERDNATVPNRDGVGPEVLRNESAGNRRGDGQGSEETGETGDRQPGNRRVPSGGAARGGSERNQGVRGGTAVDQERAAGSELPGGSSLFSDEGVQSDPSATKGLAAIAADRTETETGGTSLASKLEAQKKAESIPVKVANLENIRKTLPFLMPEQQNDVLFAEERFSKPDGYGVLFTNGTGTGKTFTGIGIVKRFARQGKNNILIVAPNDKIIAGWIDAGKNMGLDITKLEDTKSAGKGIVITTYANLGQNQELAKRHWDLVVPDESHYLSSSEQGDITGAASALRAITLHRNGYRQRFDDLERDLVEKERSAYEELRNFKPGTKEEREQYDALEKKSRDLSTGIENLRKERYEEWDAVPPEKRSRVVFLSATPFAYVKNVEYAEGYLFGYGQDTDEYRGYNQPDSRENFFITHFGYRMRYNRLTSPDANVDNEIMEQQFHEWLRGQGVLSGRMLTVDKDYDRNFVLVNDAIGGKIDEGLNWLWEAEDRKYSPLYDFIDDQFAYHQKMYLLESIKAKHAVGLVKDYLKQGKKVVLFHDFNKGGGFHPFRPEFIPEDLRSLYHEFTAKRPDLLKLDLSELLSPIEQVKQSFGEDAMFFNGTIPKKVRGKNVDLFNDDDSGKDLIVVQSDAGREGISLHDRTGKHQRVLINLGMPVRPTAAIQIEGRIYRTGQMSDAIFRYLNTGTTFERLAFATKIAERASTAENLALGGEARRLKDSFIEAYEMSGEFPAGMDAEGTGGKAKDRANRREMTEFQRAKSYYFSQQKKTSQNKSAEGNDYYATPEPIGYKMVEWANMKPGERAMEPSAGHGAIARFFPGHADHVMIEPSLQLGPRAVMVSPAKLVSNRFEDYHIINKFNAVVMNPPYGHGGKTAIEHLGKAYKHLYDGGRIVALLPDGGLADKRLNAWYDSEEATGAYPVAEIKLPSVTFERAGTGVRTKIVVIEKHIDAAGTEEIDNRHIDLSDAETIGELFDRIETISLPDRLQVQSARSATSPISSQSRETESATEEATQEDNYSKHEFRHTKNKNLIYIAKAKKYLRDNFDQHMNIAKRHDGWWNSWEKGDAVKGFAFNTDADRKAFIEESSSALREAKFSSDAGIIDNAESVDPTTNEQRIIDLANNLGAKAEIIDHADTSLRGFYMDGTLYLNRNGNLSLEWTLGHEFTHWLAENRPGVYKAMRSAVSKVTDAQVDAYRRRLGERGKAMDREAVIEEMIGDEVGNGFGSESLWEKIQKKSPALFKRIVQSVQEWLQFLTGKRSYRNSGLTREQISEIEAVLPDIVIRSLKDSGYEVGTAGKTAASQDKKFAPAPKGVKHVNIAGIPAEMLKESWVRSWAEHFWDTVGVKSPFFRSWFGDWRVNDQTHVPITTITGTEATQSKNVKAAAKEATAWAKKQPEFRGERKNKDTGWDINISKAVLNETSYYAITNGKIDSVKAIASIPDIVENAILVSTETNRHDVPEVPFVHTFVAPLSIGNNDYLTELTVKETLKGKQAYHLNAIKITPLDSHVLGRNKSAPGLSEKTNGVSANTVADLLNLVKPPTGTNYGKSSAVVDKQGMPLIVYHGTKQSFSTFDPQKIESEDGFFFTTNRDTAKEYGNIIPAYLNIKNPYRYTNKQWQNGEGFDLKQAKEAGFDGAIIKGQDGGDTYIAFYSNQIKSATDNIGTFDSSNPDIRYSGGGQPQRSKQSYTPKEIMDNINTFSRETLIDLLEQIDPNGVWSDADNAAEGYDPITLRESRDYVRQKFDDMNMLEQQVRKRGYKLLIDADKVRFSKDAQLPDKLTFSKVTQKGDNYKKLIQALNERNWTREEKPDGTIIYTKPTPQKEPIQKKPVAGDRFTFQNEETQRRAEKAMQGVIGAKESTSIKDSLKSAWDLLKRKFGREYEHMPHTAEFSEIRFALQKLQQQKGVANDKVIRILDDITKNLSKDEYYHFSLKVLLDDLQHEEGSLPFGLTKETLPVEQERLDEHIAANYPNVTKAVEQRKEVWSDIKDRYIAVMKKIGFNVENKFAREDYYRHQVLAYMDQKRIAGIGQKLKAPTNRGWLRRREGSEKDINLNYMEAEFEVMRDMLYDMEVAKTIKLVDDQYNIIDRLKAEALTMNDQNVMQVFRDMVEEFGIVSDDMTVESMARKMYKQTLNRKQAMAFAKLSELAAKDELPYGPNNKYQDVVENLAQEYFARKESSDAQGMEDAVADKLQDQEQNHAKLMEYAAYLLKEQGGKPGSGAAAMLFRGIQDKKQFVRGALGERYVTWRDLIPEGYSEWRPREGNVFFRARTVPEQMVEKLMSESLNSLGVSPEQLKTALIIGGRREGYIVKEEIAATLEKMTPDFVNDTGTKWSQYVITPWKIWQLTSPSRIIKYNLRNMTSDLDAVLAGNPSSLRKVSQSMKDLNRYFYGDGEMTNELREWFERGGMQTLLQVQEIGDINKLKLFIRFSEQKDGLENALKTGAAKVWDGYWGRARKVTDLREALLRYANYLEYLEQIESNKGRPKNFGASMSEEVMALSDNRDKAFKLANELLGDYNAVSVAGKELRKHLIPFWSWTEVNAKRYINLFRNCASNEGIAKTVGKRLLTKAAVYSPYLAVQVGEFAVKATGMWILLQMYNFALWPDEEKELPPNIAGQPHIILGRDADGKVMYFNRLGAFADFLEWFGLDTPVKTVTDYLNGKKTIAEIAGDMVKNPVNKFVQGITPTIKTTGELLIGRRLFPDVFKPRRIRDYPEYIFDSFGLGDEYRLAADKPHPRYDVMKFLLYKTEPDKTAYYNIMEEKNRFLKSIGKGGDGDYMSDQSEAIRNYKMALRYGDKKIAAKYLMEYKALGGTKQSLATALANMSPLAGLTRDQRKKFLQGLSGEDKAELLKAERYYKTVLLGGFRSRKTSSGTEKVTIPWNVDLPNKKR
ncbi:putative methyltransferase type 11 [Acetonema longum DSM 6540]|uniref:Putative methyltransferase type 11 n=2 Tax=Acetonema TaxID=2373 RepID=F7NK47_9FIRM|nr:putative methyltransferase type 11 [Acetonema longum DSM 6540]